MPARKSGPANPETTEVTEAVTEAVTEGPSIDGDFVVLGDGDPARAVALPAADPVITTVSVTFGRTQNTGNFSNLRYDVTYAANIPPGADPAVAEAFLAARAKRDVQAHIWADKDSYGEDWPPNAR